MTLTLPIKVYPPTTNVRKYFVPTKMLANFQIRSSNYNEEGGRAGRNHVYIFMSNLLLII